MALELRPTVAGQDWSHPAWKQKELAHLRGMVRDAGWTAYQGMAWSNNAIRREALRFLAQSEVLRYLPVTESLATLVIDSFTSGWRKHERAEMHAPREEPEL